MAQWYYTLNGQQTGPVDLEQLKGMVSGGQIQPNDMVWCEGMPSWQPASAVPELSGAAAQPGQPMPGQPVGYPAPGQAAGYPPGGAQIPQYYSGQPGAYGAAPSSKGMAIGAFVCSIIPCCFVWVVGLVLGFVAKGKMKSSGNFEGQGFATAAIIIGFVWAGLTVIGLILNLSGVLQR